MTERRYQLAIVFKGPGADTDLPEENQAQFSGFPVSAGAARGGGGKYFCVSVF